MRYLGPVTNAKDLATKEYVDAADTTGNAATATKWANTITITLSGVTATGQTMDGSTNITIPITAIPNSLITGLATVATSGEADDVSITDAGGYFTSTNVEGALAELAAGSSGGGTQVTLNTWSES
mgnify:FL=1